MANITEEIDLSGALEKARANIKDEMETIGREGQDEMIRVIELRDAVATGDLLSSVQHVVRSLSDRLRLTVGPDAKQGSNVAPHAPFVDQPTRPHFPPIRPLIRWAQAKFNATGDEREDIAWGAAHSIARRGTPGVRFTDAALREMRDGLTERIERAVERAFD